MENAVSRFCIKEILNVESENYSNTVIEKDGWKIICVLEGTLCVTLGGSVYRLESPGVVFCMPKDFCCITQNQNARFVLINLESKGELPKEFESCAVGITEQESLIAERVYDLKDELSEVLKYQEFSLLIELLILRCFTKQPLTAAELDRDAVIFNNATVILKQNVANQISVTELSERLKISISHLKRIFAKYAKVGVHEYFTYLKIAEAKRLLKEGQSVTYTAEITGFSNQAYFSAAFKRITGISPKEFAADVKTVRSKISKKNPQNIKTMDLPDYLL